MDRDDVRDRLGRLWERSRGAGEDYWLARFLLLRVLGLVYVAAFVSLFVQLGPLLGSQGFTPVAEALPADPSVWTMLEHPTLFWFGQADWLLYTLAGLGVALSVLLLAGFANVPLLAVNWAIYLSFVNVGGPWYAYGWELQLVETGFLAIFLVPLIDPRPFSASLPPPRPLVWLFRWLAVRINRGSGLIKLKGSPCWETLTCLDRFFQTQPIPNPVSPWLHALPSPIHKLGGAYTHAVQLLAPYTALFEDRYRLLRIGGGVLLLSLQLGLIVAGNFAFLNWLTIVPIIMFFDDRALSRVLPSVITERAERAREAAGRVSSRRHAVHLVLVVLVVLMSVPVVVNMVSPQQNMNMALSDWMLVNSYGAFGGIRDGRTELVIEGTRDTDLSDGARWREYDVPYKPDQESDPLPVVAPYQPRLAWQFWFASFSTPERQPWLLDLVWRLLHNDDQALALLAENPFPGRPPEYIRIRKYRFEMRGPLAPEPWNRTLIGTWYGPVSVESESMQLFAER